MLNRMLIRDSKILDVRLKNMLIRNGYKTMEELDGASASWLTYNIRGAGPLNISRLIKLCKEIDICIVDDRKDDGTPDLSIVDEIATKKGYRTKRPVMQKTVYSCLRLNGYKDIRELTGMHVSDISNFKGCGRVTLKRIIEDCNRFNVTVYGKEEYYAN